MMKPLIKYEFLKVLRKKSTLIAMAVSLLITAVFFGLPITQFQIYNSDGVLRGLEGIADGGDPDGALHGPGGVLLRLLPHGRGQLR